MNLESFEFLLGDDGSLKQHLVKVCWRNDARFCIRCKTRKIYRIRRDRYRCSQCGYEFSDFTGRWINKVKLPLRNWLWLIKLFEMETSARKASQQLGISYPTIYKAFHLIRQSIIAHSGSGDLFLENEIKPGEAGFENRLEANHTEGSKTGFVVFGIRERRGLVKVEPLQNFNAETVPNLTVKTAGGGSIVYTDRWESYDGLIFRRSKRFTADGGNRMSGNDIDMDKGVEGFGSYARKRMYKFHGVSEDKFPLYLKEMEFRYNHRHASIFDTLVEYLCDLTAM